MPPQAAMQRKQQEMDGLREQLTNSAEENALLRAAAERPNVEVKSPFKMDPAGLLRGAQGWKIARAVLQRNGTECS